MVPSSAGIWCEGKGQGCINDEEEGRPGLSSTRSRWQSRLTRRPRRGGLGKAARPGIQHEGVHFSSSLWYRMIQSVIIDGGYCMTTGSLGRRLWRIASGPEPRSSPHAVILPRIHFLTGEHLENRSQGHHIASQVPLTFFMTIWLNAALIHRLGPCSQLSMI